MAGSTYGTLFTITTWGESHGPALGVVIDGCPAGLPLTPEDIQQYLDRRKPGQSRYTTARKESDQAEILSGVFEGKTTGTPISILIRNQDQRSRDYGNMKDCYRPGHADYTADIKYRGFEDSAGGGHFSGRLTAPLCIAGGICIQLLQQQGISIMSRIASIGSVRDAGELIEPTADKPFPTVSDAAGEAMRREIAAAKAEGDSVGGTIECRITGLEAGLGGPLFGGMEGRIAKAVFAVPAIKGIEFGAGFAAAEMRGSENNDPFLMENGRVITKTNNCGGILGGITNAMPLTFRVAVKPTPSIAREQITLNTKTQQAEPLVIGGRHDPCIVPRAVPCIEAAAAIAVYDALLDRRKEQI